MWFSWILGKGRPKFFNSLLPLSIHITSFLKLLCYESGHTGSSLALRSSTCLPQAGFLLSSLPSEYNLGSHENSPKEKEYTDKHLVYLSVLLLSMLIYLHCFSHLFFTRK